MKLLIFLSILLTASAIDEGCICISEQEPAECRTDSLMLVTIDSVSNYPRTCETRYQFTIITDLSYPAPYATQFQYITTPFLDRKCRLTLTPGITYLLGAKVDITNQVLRVDRCTAYAKIWPHNPASTESQNALSVISKKCLDFHEPPPGYSTWPST